MDKSLDKIKEIKPSRLDTISYIILRIGLGITYIWIGVMITIEPISWSGFFPEFIRDLSYSNSVVVAAGVLDFLIGLLLVVGRFVPVASFLSAVHLLGILAFYGIDAITIRDVGLFGASLSLLLTSLSNKFKKRSNEIKEVNNIKAS